MAKKKRKGAGRKKNASKKSTKRRRKKNPSTRGTARKTSNRRRKTRSRTSRGSRKRRRNPAPARRRRRKNPDLPSLRNGKFADAVPWAISGAVGWTLPGLILGYLPSDFRNKAAQTLGNGLRLKAATALLVFFGIGWAKKHSKMVRDYEPGLKAGALLAAAFNVAADVLPRKGWGLRLRLAMNIPGSFSYGQVTQGGKTTAGTLRKTGTNATTKKASYEIDDTGISDYDFLDTDHTQLVSVGDAKQSFNQDADTSMVSFEGPDADLAGYTYSQSIMVPDALAQYQFTQPASLGGYEYNAQMDVPGGMAPHTMSPDGMGEYHGSTVASYRAQRGTKHPYRRTFR